MKRGKLCEMKTGHGRYYSPLDYTISRFVEIYYGTCFLSSAEIRVVGAPINLFELRLGTPSIDICRQCRGETKGEKNIVKGGNGGPASEYKHAMPPLNFISLECA